MWPSLENGETIDVTPYKGQTSQSTTSLCSKIRGMKLEFASNGLSGLKMEVFLLKVIIPILQLQPIRAQFWFDSSRITDWIQTLIFLSQVPLRQVLETISGPQVSLE